MSVAAYTALHYGREYLAYAIRSVIDVVDEYWVLYSPFGSHGHRSDTSCPERMEDLYGIAKAAAGGKLRWCNGRWPTEGQQRDYIHHLTDADIVLVLDADEIWADGAAAYALAMAQNADIGRFRIPIIHFWRSFYRAVLCDPAYPVRLIKRDADSREGTLHVSPICHMGYAQSPAIVEYKWQVHGHKAELRTDVDWLRDRYRANAQEDCHPVGSVYWNPEPVEPLDYMPAFMAEHPYFGMEVIA